MQSAHLREFLSRHMKRRKIRNWSHLAEEIGRSPQMVHKWTRGSVTISRAAESKIIEALNLSAGAERELGRLIRAVDAERRDEE